MNNFDQVVVELDGEQCTFYKCIIPREAKLREVQEWLNGSSLCEDYIWNNGIFPGLNTALFNNKVIFFKNKEDATMFLLTFY